MNYPVSSLFALAGLPSSKPACIAWLRRHNVPLSDDRGRFTFHLSDLPEPERLAFLARRAEATGLPMGVQDDAAHLALAAKPKGVQDSAYARAETMMFIARHRAAGLTQSQIAWLLRTEAAKAGSLIIDASRVTLGRWAERIAGLDPINWAPALAPNYQGRTATAEVSPEAWEQFEFYIYTSGKNGTGFPLKAAWEKVVDDASARGWAWPCYRTVMRHWERLDKVRKRALRDGEEAAIKSLKQSQPRTVEGMFAMQQVELDGREFKVLVRFRDGRIGCPWVIIYVDRASNRILSHVIVRTFCLPVICALPA